MLHLLCSVIEIFANDKIFLTAAGAMHEAGYVYSYLEHLQYQFPFEYNIYTCTCYLIGCPLGKCTWMFDCMRNLYINNAYITLFSFNCNMFSFISMFVKHYISNKPVIALANVTSSLYSEAHMSSRFELTQA